MVKLGRFEDHRGTIQDLLATTDAVTEIFTLAGCVRGNHVHRATIQWTYIVSGSLIQAWQEDDGIHQATRGPRDFFREPPGIAHAWKALEDTVVLVFTRGPRAGDDYERDTHRLETPLLT